MIGHHNDISVIVRRTELPVVLLPGTSLLGFARQHIVRQFRSPWLAPLGMFSVGILGILFFVTQTGFFQSYDDFMVSEIAHLQPQGMPTPTSSETCLSSNGFL